MGIIEDRRADRERMVATQARGIHDPLVLEDLQDAAAGTRLTGAPRCVG